MLDPGDQIASFDDDCDRGANSMLMLSFATHLQNGSIAKTRGSAMVSTVGSWWPKADSRFYKVDLIQVDFDGLVCFLRRGPYVEHSRTIAMKFEYG